jgi:hypothetical protein
MPACKYFVCRACRFWHTANKISDQQKLKQKRHITLNTGMQSSGSQQSSDDSPACALSALCMCMQVCMLGILSKLQETCLIQPLSQLDSHYDTARIAAHITPMTRTYSIIC